MDDKQCARTGLSADLLKQIVDAVRQDAKPQRIILFGSRARGEWNDRSDIDIAVIPESGSIFFSAPFGSIQDIAGTN
jgi:predicted nucleotidyltransferase